MKTLLTLLLLTLQLYSFEYIISEKELSTKVSQEFPITEEFFFSKFIFFDPILTINKKTNLIVFECSIKNSSIVLENGEVPTFRVQASSGIRYHGQKIYLTGVKVTKVTNKNLSQDVRDKLSIGVQLLLNAYFKEEPIFDSKDAVEEIRTISSIIKDVIIDDGAIKVLF